MDSENPDLSKVSHPNLQAAPVECDLHPSLLEGAAEQGKTLPKQVQAHNNEFGFGPKDPELEWICSGQFWATKRDPPSDSDSVGSQTSINSDPISRSQVEGLPDKMVDRPCFQTMPKIYLGKPPQSKGIAETGECTSDTLRMVVADTKKSSLPPSN